MSCEVCRRSKLRCDRRLPCNTCLKRGLQSTCGYKSKSTEPEHHTTVGLNNDRTTAQPQVQAPISESQRASSPQAQTLEPVHQQWDLILRRPSVEKSTTEPSPSELTVNLSFGPSTTTSDLLAMLPPSSIIEHLLTRYFCNLSPLFHILHGPSFQKQYVDFSKDPARVRLSWLAVLYAILSLTLKTMDVNDASLSELWQDTDLPRDLSFLSQRYQKAAMMSLSEDQFLVRHELHTLEALLILIHMISHCEGPEHGWALLGTALNIAIALRCHKDAQGSSNIIERERSRRCWSGILILHMHQSLCFRDIDMAFLLKIQAPMPAWTDDNNIRESDITNLPQMPFQRTDMSLMKFQTRLSELSTQICSHISGSDRFSEDLLHQFDASVSEEQQVWDKVYRANGTRSILDAAGYAHWCLLQNYAHQLFLLLHRPFHSSRSSRFRSESRDRCIKSGLALLDIHHQFFELPRLESYRWLTKGAISCNALHGAVSLTSCILDMSDGLDLTPYISNIDAAVRRLEALKTKSPACANVYPILRCLRYVSRYDLNGVGAVKMLNLDRSYLSKPEPTMPMMREDLGTKLEDWAQKC